MYLGNDLDEEIEALGFDARNDRLNFASDPDIKAMISTEQLLFSDRIEKTNKYGWPQKRFILITDCALYNLSGKVVKRRLDISKLKGVTVSVEKDSQEFVVHGDEEEYDYLYTSPLKYNIIYLLEKAFERLKGSKLLFVYTDAPYLHNRMTTKSEKESNPRFSRMDESELSDIREFFKNVYLDENGEMKYNAKKDSQMMPLQSALTFVRPRKEPLRYFNPEGSSRQSVDIIKNEERKLTLWDNIDKQSEDAFEFADNDDGEDLEKPLKPAKLADFAFLKCIGEGKFSKTYIARSTKNGVIYAVKVTNKLDLLQNEVVENLINEKKILTTYTVLSNKYIVPLVNCFQTFDKVFFTYTFYRGGDLYAYASSHEIDDKTLKSIVCQTVAFLISLHGCQIIYRNLKPENILMDDRGHLKFTDFSKAKVISFKGDLGLDFVGPFDYMAPEVIQGKAHSLEVDWWMLGVLIYFLLYKKTPFYSASIDKTYNKILFCGVKYPGRLIYEPVIDLVNKLLSKDPAQRLNDVSVKNHHYFSMDGEVNWDNIESRIEPMFDRDNQEDVRNFDKEFTEQTVAFDEVKDGESLLRLRAANSQGAFGYFN